MVFICSEMSHTRYKFMTRKRMRSQFSHLGSCTTNPVFVAKPSNFRYSYHEQQNIIVFYKYSTYFSRRLFWTASRSYVTDAIVFVQIMNCTTLGVGKQSRMDRLATRGEVRTLSSVHVLFVVPVQRRCTRTTFKPIVGGIITQSILGQNLHLTYVQHSIVSVFS